MQEKNDNMRREMGILEINKREMLKKHKSYNRNEGFH